jgi:hypothetical protein
MDGAKSSAGDNSNDSTTVRQHVREMLTIMREKLRAAKASVDYTVEVDREKNRSGGVDGV